MHRLQKFSAAFISTVGSFGNVEGVLQKKLKGEIDGHLKKVMKIMISY